MLYQDILRRYRPAPRPPVVSRETPPPPPPPEPAPAGELGAPPSEAAPVVTVDTDVVQATITTLGARLPKLGLKEYRRSVQPDCPALAADSAGGGRTPGRETAVALHENRLIEKSATDLARQAVTLADCSWAGFATQYFMSAAMPADARGQVVMTTAAEVPIVRIDVPVVDGRASAAVFVGPKDRAVLTRAGRDLDRALDFGWFWFIAIPLLRALHLLRSVTGNYGVAIIVLTVLVKLATTPLTQTTFRNMREMQKIQPQMAKLKERFKDDQMALQKEMMELYRRHRVNPLSGCLPMVLQLPIFVGLYNALSHAIELRHAPFALWINDLSAPDRLPIPGIPLDTPLS